MLLAMLLICCLNAPQETTVDTDTIALSDLLPLSEADPRNSVGLGYAPNPGLARRITKDTMIMKIESAGFSADDLQLPASILVRRQAQSLDVHQVRQAILEAFVQQFPAANVEITDVDVPATQVGSGLLTITASLPARFVPGNTTYVRLDVRGDDFARAVFVRAVARVETMQPVIQRPIAANSAVRADDIEWKLAPLSSNKESLMTLDGLEGMLAKRDLSPGQVLNSTLLYMPLYVRKGESVTVRVTSGSITIAATMRAREAGRLGDTVMVEHLTGGGITTARIVGPRTLEVIQR